MTVGATLTPAISQPAVAVTGAQEIVADAIVLPAEQSDLSFAIGGTIARIAITEGERVKAGQILIELDSAALRTAVSQAEANLDRAKAQYANLVAGPRPQEISAAEATLAVAQAQLDSIRNGSLPGQLAAAKAGLSAAEAKLQQVLQGSSQQELIVARVQVADAEAALKQAQSAFDRVRSAANIGALPESAALQQATNNFTAAQARLQDLENGATPAEIDVARAEVRRAQAQEDQLQGSSSGDLNAAEAQVRQVQAQLDLLKAGNRPEDIAAAKANVAAATAALQQALVSLAQTQLAAPFDGTVAQLNVNPGEAVAQGQVVIRFADLAHWEIRTDDLTELQIVGIKPGDKVLVGFDAVPDLALQGIVERIRPIGGDLRGDVVYTAIVKLDKSDERLLWNMTAIVKFRKQ